jgi:hypothetical protein
MDEDELKKLLLKLVKNQDAIVEVIEKHEHTNNGSFQYAFSFAVAASLVSLSSYIDCIDRGYNLVEPNEVLELFDEKGDKDETEETEEGQE